MFEARKRVFIDLLKWDIPALAGRFELDHFDDVDATYLIVTDADGEHLASARLLLTTRPALLDSLFPELVDGPVPQGARSEEHTSELQSLMRISYAVFCLKKKTHSTKYRHTNTLTYQSDSSITHN